MYAKKECVAMLLAGGQGSRLYTLTDKTAKPAVEFGGKYRIIDFPLSNCVNSGIDTVGVLTQYQPLVLNEYIGTGKPWDLDRMNGGVHILPPYQGKISADWYKGTANAIYQNLTFINRYDPDHVLILSGDHIYKMDYAKMLRAHKEADAACTIAVLQVPMEEAHRFGIMNADENGIITDFEEKPAQPKSNKASMGIYIFKRDLLEQYLRADAKDPASDNDFGKNVIPAMLAAGEKMLAYPFEGYWKDVGTLDSLWEANMDLLGTHPNFDLHDTAWRIFSRTNPKPPHFVGDTARIQDSLLTEGCRIHGMVYHSVLFEGVTVEEGAVVRDAVLMGNVTVKKGARVEYCIIDHDTVIEENAIVGKSREEGGKLCVVCSDVTLRSGTQVDDGVVANLSYLREHAHLKVQDS